jgi:hypothetical protein
MYLNLSYIAYLNAKGFLLMELLLQLRIEFKDFGVVLRSRRQIVHKVFKMKILLMA